MKSRRESEVCKGNMLRGEEPQARALRGSRRARRRGVGETVITVTLERGYSEEKGRTQKLRVSKVTEVGI